MRRWFLRLVAAVLFSAGVLWLAGVASRPRPVAVQRVVNGNSVTLDEVGAGSTAVILSEGGDASDLAPVLASDYRVVVVPAGLLVRPKRLALASLLDQLGAVGNVVIVGSVPVVVSLLEDVESPTRRVIRVVALDVRAAAIDQADVGRLFATTSPHVFLVSTPSSLTWSHYRTMRPNGGPRVSLVEACGDGFTRECAADLAPLLAPLSTASVWPGTGTVLRDAMRSGAPAPAVVVVPNGQFRAGTSSDRADALDAIASFSVSLPGRIAVARTETVVAEFRRFVDATGYQPGQGCWYHTVEQEWKLDEKGSWSAPVFAQADDHPVTCITFEDAEAFAAWLSRETGHVYRLPTEAEFEFFNRSGRPGDSAIGAAADSRLCAAANGADRTTGLSYAHPCVDGYAATAPVGRFGPNDFGLYDTTGNLWELTLDCWQNAYMRAFWNLAPRRLSGSAQNTGDCPALHVVRGGSFLSSALNLRFGHRDVEGYRSSRVGFRVVRELH